MLFFCLVKDSGIEFLKAGHNYISNKIPEYQIRRDMKQIYGKNTLFH